MSKTLFPQRLEKVLQAKLLEAEQRGEARAIQRLTFSATGGAGGSLALDPSDDEDRLDPEAARYLMQAMVLTAPHSEHVLSEFMHRVGEHAGKKIGFSVAWNENLHPRDDHGRFVKGAAIAEARRDPAAAARLRAQVTDPDERAKLDAQIDHPTGRTTGLSATGSKGTQKLEETHAHISQLAEKAKSPGGLQIDDLKGLAASLNRHTAGEIKDLKKMLDLHVGGVLKVEQVNGIIDKAVDHQFRHAGTVAGTKAETRPNGTPVSPVVEDVHTVPVKSLKIDPERFQYKVNGIGEKGVGKELADVKQYNPELGGVLLAWRDPESGEDFVVNGHHRHELADRSGHPTVNVRYIQAKDAAMARAKGAMANIAEGRGTAVDAAKYLRDTGSTPDDLRAAGVSLSGKVAADAVVLNGLSDKAFGDVVTGRLDEERAVAVAKHLPTPELQDKLFGKLSAMEEGGKEWSRGHIETAAKKMAASGFVTKTGHDLFGGWEHPESTFDQEVELDHHVTQALGKEASDYAAVSNAKRADRVKDAGNVLSVEENQKRRDTARGLVADFEREKNLKGPVADAIRRHAGELAKAKTEKEKKDVRAKTIDSVRAALAGQAQPGDPQADGGGAGRGEPGRAADPAVAGEPAAPARPAPMTKAEAKAYIANMPAPGKLSQQHDAYFNVDKADETVPMDKIAPLRARPDGVANAGKFMEGARQGVLGKRDPVKVVKNADGTYTVADGNSTFANAQQSGWTDLPVQLVSQEWADDEQRKTVNKEYVKAREKMANERMFREDEIKLPNTARTPFDSWQQVKAAAEQQKPAFDKILNHGEGVEKSLGAKVSQGDDEQYLADLKTPGAVVRLAPIKGEKRATEKVTADYGGDWGKLGDAVRASVAVDSAAEIPKAIEALRVNLESQGWKLAKAPKNKFLKPTLEGYSDVNLSVQAPDGTVGEVQVHLKPMLTAKANAHHLYEQQRTIGAAAKQRGAEEATPEEAAKVAALVNAQRELYGSAWLSSLGLHQGEGKASEVQLGALREMWEKIHGKDWEGDWAKDYKIKSGGMDDVPELDDPGVLSGGRQPGGDPDGAGVPAGVRPEHSGVADPARPAAVLPVGGADQRAAVQPGGPNPAAPAPDAATGGVGSPRGEPTKTPAVQTPDRADRYADRLRRAVAANDHVAIHEVTSQALRGDLGPAAKAQAEAGFDAHLSNNQRGGLRAKHQHYLNALGDRPVAPITAVTPQQPAAGETSFVPHPRAKSDPDNHVTVQADIKKLDAELAKEKDSYIPPGGGGAEIEGRRAGFEQFLGTGQPVEQPFAAVGPGGQVRIGDGRHRLSVIRDKGGETIPLSVHKDDAEAILKKVGTRPAAEAGTHVERMAAADHKGKLDAMPPGATEVVNGYHVTRNADGSFAHQIGGKRTLKAGTAEEVAAAVAGGWAGQKWQGKRIDEALKRGDDHEPGNPFDPSGLDRAAAEEAKAEGLPDGVEGVSLADATRGRVGTVKRDATGRPVLAFDDAPDEYASSHFEPLEEKHSWRVADLTPKKGEPKAATGSLFEPAEGERRHADTPEADKLNHLAGGAIPRKTLQKTHRNMQKYADLFTHGYTVSHWLNPSNPHDQVLEFNPTGGKGRVSGRPRLTARTGEEVDAIHAALGIPAGESRYKTAAPEQAPTGEATTPTVEVAPVSQVAPEPLDPTPPDDWRGHLIKTRVYAKQLMDAGKLDPNAVGLSDWEDHKVLADLIDHANAGVSPAELPDKVQGVANAVEQQDVRKTVGRLAGDLAQETDPKEIATRLDAAAMDLRANLGHIPDAVKAAEQLDQIAGEHASVVPADAHQPASAVSGNPHVSLADHLAERFRNGESVTSKELFAAANQHHGGTRAQGKYGVSEAYDSMEAGLNKALVGHSDPRADLAGAQQQARDLAERVKQLPTQTNRSGNKDSYQQFSTPPHYAFAAAWVANLAPGEHVLEPSAGTGSLAVHAKNAGADVTANELDPRRADLLRSMVGANNVHTENAEQIAGILPGRGVAKPTTVLMNPPFSQTAGRMGNKKELLTGAKHIQEAASMLPEGGRAVAIVGRGMTPEAPTYREWFEQMEKRGLHLRANVGVEGDEYKKYGTGFGTRLLVFDKGAQPTAPPVVGEAADIPDLLSKLEGVRNDRPEVGAAPPEQRAGDGTPVATGGAGEPVPAGGAATGAGVPGPEPVAGPVGAAADAGAVSGAEPGAGGGTAAPKPRRVRRARGGVAGGGVAGTGGATGQPDGGTEGGGDAGSGGATAAGKPGKRGEARVPSLRPPAPVPLKGEGGEGAEGAEGAEKGRVAAAAGSAPQQSGGEDSLYQSYQPSRMKIPGSVPHPAALVESAAMSAVQPPEPTYQPHLSPDLVEMKEMDLVDAKGRPYRAQVGLSAAGLESVVYAGQAHNKFLPAGGGTDLVPDQSYFSPGGTPFKLIADQDNKKWYLDGGGVWHNFTSEHDARQFMASNGWKDKNGSPIQAGEQPSRRGYFIGDGTGAGKGRQIAGIMTDNWNQGSKKHVWVSEKQSLLDDAHRDWREMGQNPADLHHFDKIRSGKSVPGQGVAFITYDTLKGRPTDAAKDSNLETLVKWLGPDFDGVIAFDEAHGMGNALGSEGARGATKPSAKALAGVELQRRLPNAKVVYVSATGATEVSNLAYADRLGLWGRGTPFPTKEAFINQMEEGGVAAMESVAQSMKAMGMYGARSLSFDDGTENGKVTYDRLTHSLTDDQTAMYDAASSGWQQVLKHVDRALELTGGKMDKNAKSAALSQFWGAQQRFFNQVMTSMQTPSVIKAMEEDLAKGHSPVVQLVNTMEAATGRATAKAKADGMEDLESLDISPKEVLMQYLERSFPVHRYEEFEDEDGNTQMRPVLDGDGNPVTDPDAVAMREKLLDDMGALRIPESPLDMILNHFGHENVAEATGRTQRLLHKTMPDGTTRRVLEPRQPASANVAEADAFQGGKKKIMVFSDAGGTGKSYHADRKAANQGKRIHYMLQPGWRADKAVQGLGRTHRTNQTQAPEFRLVQIEQLKAQKRFLSTIARRLDQLGALTKGQRQAGSSGLFSAADNLESREAKDALDLFFRDVSANKVPGVDHKELLSQLGYANDDEEKKAGRRRGSPKQFDTPPMSQFLNRMLSLSVGMQGKVFEAFEKRLSDTVEKAITTGTMDTGVEKFRADHLKKLDETVVYRDPESGAEAKMLKLNARRRTEREPFETNMKGEKPIMYVRNKQSGRVRAVYSFGNATDTRTGQVIPQVVLRGPKWRSGQKIEPAAGVRGDMYDARYTRLDEGEAKKLWDEEHAALPEYTDSEEHFLTGAILPIWDRIPSGRSKVYRMTTDDGESAVGRHIPEDQLKSVLQRLNVQMKGSEFSHEDAHRRLESGTHTATLANGWTLKPARVGGERRIELVGSGYAAHPELIADGLIKERVGYDTRFFVPTGPAGVQVLRRITKSRPVAEMRSVKGDD